MGLADNRIGDNGATALAELLRYTDTLQKLVLSGNDIHDEGGGTLVASLSQNTSLTGLYLAGVSGSGSRAMLIVISPIIFSIFLGNSYM